MKLFYGGVVGAIIHWLGHSFIEWNWLDTSLISAYGAGERFMILFFWACFVFLGRFSRKGNVV